MNWLNYHHLLYFWTVAREGSIAAACRELRLAQPTISAQIKSLEEAVGEPLFTRAGRRLELTDAGRTAFQYADEIFALGRELSDTLSGRPTGAPIRLRVGIADVLPKLVAYRLLRPAVEGLPEVRVVGHEGKANELIAKLAIHEFDLVLSDSAFDPHLKIRAFNHQLGRAPVSVFAARRDAARYKRNFPRSLDGAQFILPTENTALRRSLDGWFDASGLRPRIVGEFQDSALLRVFGAAGAGLFVGPTPIEKEICRAHGVAVVGRIPEVFERYFAISLERRVKHPAVAAIVENAGKSIFA
jgi:LysR family transcriptional activator of nhaA